MPSEIQVDAVMAASKGSLDIRRKVGVKADLAGTKYAGGVQIIGTAAEPLAMGDVSAAGWGVFVNLDTTNFVTIGALHSAVFVPVAKLKPGEVAVLRLATNAPYALADTASVNLEFLILEA